MTPGEGRDGYRTDSLYNYSSFGPISRCTYDTFDILTDETVRQELKTYSDWPTYPQVYVKGELIGGLDIIKDLLQGGELNEALGISK